MLDVNEYNTRQFDNQKSHKQETEKYDYKISKYQQSIFNGCFAFFELILHLLKWG